MSSSFVALDFQAEGVFILMQLLDDTINTIRFLLDALETVELDSMVQIVSV